MGRKLAIEKRGERYWEEKCSINKDKRLVNLTKLRIWANAILYGGHNLYLNENKFTGMFQNKNE